MFSTPARTQVKAPRRVRLVRAAAVVLSLMIGGGAAAIFIQYSAVNGLTPLGLVSAVFLFFSTTWLAWGACLGLVGLKPFRPRRPFTYLPPKGRTVVLVPVYNEDPKITFARVAAMYRSVCKATDLPVHFAILSDTRDATIAQAEDRWFAHLLADTGGAGRLFYRRRAQNTGRKAGNIEDFFARSGAAYDFALILDADSLMEGDTIVEMIRRMEADPELGLLQSLPAVVRAQSVFGRVMQ
ncbi:MAG: glycosyltransferase, partial [Rhodobacteraceae bacterium]|nr:glycosyltransferase [Paracoccaceae bacterium]